MKALIIFLSIVCILILVAIFLISQGNKTNRLVRLYKKILDSNKYTFTMEETRNENAYKMTVSQKENKNQNLIQNHK